MRKGESEASGALTGFAQRRPPELAMCGRLQLACRSGPSKRPLVSTTAVASLGGAIPLLDARPRPRASPDDVDCCKRARMQRSHGGGQAGGGSPFCITVPRDRRAAVFARIATSVPVGLRLDL
jgi:hypothetical protein